METIENVKSCLVIGAGIAGLLAARTLQERGLRITVLDKGRGVGGRMATRRIGSAVFDHWRFAKPAVLYPASCLTLAEPLPLVFAGDAFGAPRVEGAALSGLAAAQAVLDTCGGRDNP